MTCSVCSQLKDVTGSQLILWEKPTASGVVLAGLLSIIVIFGFFEYTIVTFLCRVVQLMFVVVGGLVYLHMFPSSDDIKTCISNSLDKVQPSIAKGLDALFRLLAWEDVKFSAMVLVGTIFFALLGNLFSDLWLLFLGTVALFTLPIGYTKNKVQIDSILLNISALKELNRIVDKILNSNKVKTN